MTYLELVAELLKYTIPSLALFLGFYYFSNRWFKIQDRKLLKLEVSSGTVLKEVDSENAKVFFPLQIDAVQRLVLFLERIAPNNMVMRLLNAGLPARNFQQKLLDSIRSEFEHNLAQQVYISSESWEVVQQSKEEVIKIINMAATKLDDTSLAGDLAKGIFEISAQLKSQPTDIAIEMLKSELRGAIK